MSCLGKCAAAHPSPKALPLLQCLQKNCKRKVLIGAVRSLPDCKTSGCPSECECAEKSRVSEINACLADATCSAGEDCVLQCPCNDMTCYGNCFAAPPSPLALTVLQCVQKNCKHEAPVLNVTASTLPDCSKVSACPSECDCAEKTCTAEINA